MHMTMAQNDFSQGEPVRRSAIGIYIMNKQMWLGLCLAFIATNGMAAAGDDIDSTLDRHLDRAQELFSEKQLGDAITNEINPVIDHYEAQYAGSTCRVYCTHSPAEEKAYRALAESNHQAAVIIGATWAEAYYLKAYAQVELGLHSEAQSNLVLALKYSPYNAKYLNELAYNYQIDKHVTKSRLLFEQAATCARDYLPEEERNTELTRALRGTGYALTELGQYDDAEGKYRECLQIDKKDGRAAAELEYIKDQRIFHAVHISPGMISEMAMLSELSPLPGLENITPAVKLAEGDPDALHNMQEEAVGGDVQAQFNLGLAYGDGRGVPKDYAEAAKWLRLAAEQGNALAAYGLGVLYTDGLGVQSDGAEAFKWFRQSADAGDVLGECGLGMAYAQGIGVSTDEVEAAKCFLKSALQGNAAAMNNLGVVSGFGNNPDGDPKESVKWYLKAAEQGEPKAQTKIAYMYSGGVYLPEDTKEAARWYRCAAEQGEVFAQAVLGIVYFFGDGVSQDYSEAAKWFQKAAEQGNSKAQYMLGMLYCSGDGVEQDYAKAMNWFEKAAEQGDGAAMQNIGVMYINGDGVPQDYKMAMKWCRKATEWGNKDAAYEVALMYFRGAGVPQDQNRSLLWMKQAALLGHTKAQEVIREMNK